MSVTVCRACLCCLYEKKQDETFLYLCLLLQNPSETEGEGAAPGSPTHSAGQPGDGLPHIAHGAEEEQSPPSKKTALKDLIWDFFTEGTGQCNDQHWDQG